MTIEQDYYENPQHWVEVKYEGPEMERIETLAKKIPPNVTSLLDAGCGNGLFLRHLSIKSQRGFKRLCGVDRSEAALAHVTCEKIKASVDVLPFDAGEFDMVCSTEVLEHLPQEIYKNTLKEIARIAKNWIMISVPYNERIALSQTVCNLCHCRFNPNYHLRSFNERDMQTMFYQDGFICREVFKIHVHKKVPDSIEELLRYFGGMKRAILSQTPSMRANTICPACGNETKKGNETGSKKIDQQPATIGTIIRSFLSITTTYRWVGAVYERQDKISSN